MSFIDGGGGGPAVAAFFVAGAGGESSPKSRGHSPMVIKLFN